MIQRRVGPSECLICYRPANGYHCGVPSCKGCKTFFRRMCISASAIYCKLNDNCFDSSRKKAINIRCQACRFRKCIDVGMDPLALELKDEDRKTVNIKTMRSKEILANKTIQLLAHIESRLEAFRISAYNPNFTELGSLLELLECENRLSMADRLGPMPGWPLRKDQVIIKNIASKSLIRDVPDTQPPHFLDRKVWMVFNTFTTIEYIKTFEFFNRLDIKDKLILTGHVALLCMYFHMSYFAVAKKVDGFLQPDGSESPQKDECHYAMTSMVLAPLIKHRVEPIEYVLLKAICVCNPTVQNLSEHAQIILTQERQRYAGVLFDYCQKNRNNGPSRFVELLGIIPIMEQHQLESKAFFILRIAPILMKYKQIAVFLKDIMYS